MKKKGNINVTTENIFPIIKQFLYSDHEIFLRELVSNAVDATQKMKTLITILDRTQRKASNNRKRCWHWPLGCAEQKVMIHLQIQGWVSVTIVHKMRMGDSNYRTEMNVSRARFSPWLLDLSEPPRQPIFGGDWREAVCRVWRWRRSRDDSNAEIMSHHFAGTWFSHCNGWIFRTQIGILQWGGVVCWVDIVCICRFVVDPTQVCSRWIL